MLSYSMTFLLVAMCIQYCDVLGIIIQKMIVNYCDHLLIHSMSLEGPTSAAVNMLTNAAVQAVRQLLCYFLAFKSSMPHETSIDSSDHITCTVVNVMETV